METCSSWTASVLYDWTRSVTCIVSGFIWSSVSAARASGSRNIDRHIVVKMASKGKLATEVSDAFLFLLLYIFNTGSVTMQVQDIRIRNGWIQRVSRNLSTLSISSSNLWSTIIVFARFDDRSRVHENVILSCKPRPWRVIFMECFSFILLIDIFYDVILRTSIYLHSYRHSKGLAFDKNAF